MKHVSRERSDANYAMVLTIPAVLLAFLFIIVPIIDSIIKSFLEYGVKNIISGKAGVWNDFENYSRLFQAGSLPEATINTFTFVIFVILFQLILGMTLALIINSNIKGARFFRSIMMTPWVVPTVISALIWMWLFQPQYGFIRYFVSFLTGGNISDFAMLNNPETALFGVSIAALWKQIPLMTLLLLAGLQNIPTDVLEAAKIDGAGKIRQFLFIVLPYLSPVIKVSVSMAIIENFKQFPLFWTMTGGGPNGSTTNLAILSYREAFVSLNLGSGAAVTTIWMILMVIVIAVYNRVFKTHDMS